MMEEPGNIATSFGYSFCAAHIAGYLGAVHLKARIGNRAMISFDMRFGGSFALGMSFAVSSQIAVLAGVYLSLFLNGT